MVPWQLLYWFWERDFLFFFNLSSQSESVSWWRMSDEPRAQLFINFQQSSFCVLFLTNKYKTWEQEKVNIINILYGHCKVAWDL